MRHSIARFPAWHDLGLPARYALIELLHRYTGINNGMIRLEVRELAGRGCLAAAAGSCRCAVDTCR